MSVSPTQKQSSDCVVRYYESNVWAYALRAFSFAHSYTNHLFRSSDVKLLLNKIRGTLKIEYIMNLHYKSTADDEKM